MLEFEALSMSVESFLQNTSNESEHEENKDKNCVKFTRKKGTFEIR